MCSEIVQMLEKAFGRNIMCKSRVYEWYSFQRSPQWHWKYGQSYEYCVHLSQKIREATVEAGIFTVHMKHIVHTF